MKKLTTVVLLSAAFAGAACGTNQGSILTDAGLTTSIDTCNPASGTYVGFLELTRAQFEVRNPVPHVGIGIGGSARFFVNGPPYPSAPLNGGSVVFCGSTPEIGQCCSGPLPFDPDAGPGRVGPEFVTCVDPQGAGSNLFASMTDPYGGAAWSENWSGGDSLQCSADGGVAGSFATSVSTPPDLVGLSHDLFPLDGGPVTISRTQDLQVTWTAGASESTVVINLLGSTSGVSCVAADTGSFSVPSALLNQFPPGDQGGIAMYRYIAACVQAPSVHVSVLVENGILQSVVYP